MADAPSDFQWGTLQPGEIRLLRPKVGADGLNTFHLSQHDVQKAPPYYALSYVCGKDEPSYHILCSSRLSPEPKSIAITPNLSEALTAIFKINSQEGSRVQFEYLWVDSICINQNDLAEKAQQVADMGRVYEKAERALIWLGKQLNESDLAIDVLNNLASLKMGPGQASWTRADQSHSISNVELSALHVALEAKAKIRHSEDAFRNLGIPPFDHPLWPALAALFSRNWFFRLWTFQEAALAKDGVVVCGARTIWWTDFRALGLLLIETDLLYRSLSALSMPRQNNVSIDRRQALIFAFNFALDEARTWFLLYVRQARLREVTLPADRIFAIRALASGTIQARIPVKYSKEPGGHLETYKNAAKALLQQYPYGTVIGQLNSEKRPSQLPSWCPDFDSVPEESPFPTSVAIAPNFAKFFREDPRLSDVVYVGGACIDTIDRVVSDFSWRWPQEDFSSIYGPNGRAADILSWLDTCWQLVVKTLGDSDGVAHSIYLSALLAEVRHRRPSEFPPEPAASLAALRKRLEALKMSTPETKPSLSADQEQLIQPIFTHLGRLWPNREFFSTTGKRFGIASKRIQAGDKIYTLFGESQLFVFRSRGTQAHQVIGETYVTELSDGEGGGNLEDKQDILAVV